MKGGAHSMTDNRDIERFLAEMPVPEIQESSHRERLRSSLLREMRKERVTMSSWKKTLAWAACFVMVVAMTGLTAQQINKLFTVKEHFVVTTEHPDAKNVGDFYIEHIYSIESPDIDAESPEGKKIIQEIKALIDAEKYTFIEHTKDSTGTDRYTYSVTLSSGDEHSIVTNRPLKDIIDTKKVDILISKDKNNFTEETVRGKKEGNDGE